MALSAGAGEDPMAEEARSRLGRGLAALIGDVGDESAVLERTRSQRRVAIEFLRPNPRNPRRNFSEAELDELAASIRNCWRIYGDSNQCGARAVNSRSRLMISVARRR